MPQLPIARRRSVTKTHSSLKRIWPSTRSVKFSLIFASPLPRAVLRDITRYSVFQYASQYFSLSEAAGTSSPTESF